MSDLHLYNNPSEIVDYCETTATHKTANIWYRTLILALFAGVYIALGALASIVGAAQAFGAASPFTKLIAASIFPVGLMLVVIGGGELFTGNCLIFVGLVRRTISASALFKNLVLVWLGNLAGSLLIVAIASYTGSLDADALAYLHSLAVHKAHAPFLAIVLKGMVCNILVAGAVWLAYAGKDIISKLIAIWFPIMAFILLGYDHVVANMFYLPYAYLTGADLQVVEIMHNWLAATIGNFCGGALFLAGLYCVVFPKRVLNKTIS